MRREYPVLPIVGVAAIVFSDGKVLLVRRGNEPGRGRMGLPGGVIELGESVEQAVIREVKEECGIEIKPLRIVAVRDSITYDEFGKIRFHYILVNFLCSTTHNVVFPSSDVLDAKWIKIDDLEKEGISSSLSKFIKNTLARQWIV
jgi:mutator protein MutT